MPSAQPQPAEVAEMARRANEVVRLLEELRRLNAEESTPPSSGSVEDARRSIEATPMEIDGDQRPPKRPWEAMEMEGEEVDELDVRFLATEVESFVWLIGLLAGARPGAAVPVADGN